MSHKCLKCGKTAYENESLQIKESWFHKTCFKCAECDIRLTLTTYQVSDFGENEVFCAKCVPKVAPSQAKDQEIERAQKASKMTQEVRMVNEQVRVAEETPSSYSKPVSKSVSAIAAKFGSGAPKCPTCGKSAYPAESVNVKGDTYHNACFKCCECNVRLTLSTYEVSDFGEREIFCRKCVPKVAPSQATETVELARAQKASQMTQEVRKVNDQVRVSEEEKAYELSKEKKVNALSAKFGGGLKKCPRCLKTVYAAEEIVMEGDSYHKTCFRCCECDQLLNLNTYKKSDFAQNDIFCTKCVPKVAPTQANTSVELDRVAKAAQMTKDVRMVNEQVRNTSLE
eukprot:m.136495 g.136495  ORF g.136495 m.136495 type:complete len:341 (-) comp10705_c0_seq1:927-1949(-)